MNVHSYCIFFIYSNLFWFTAAIINRKHIPKSTAFNTWELLYSLFLFIFVINRHMNFTPQVKMIYVLMFFCTTGFANASIHPLPTFYADFDGDGYGDPFNFLVTPEMPEGYVANNDDCNDESFFINPGRPEICNNFDDNCNAETDEGLTFTIYYADEDADGYGSPDVFISSCQSSPPAGYSNDFTDCNDFYFFANPGAVETCNGIDDNCDTNIDEGVIGLFFVDADDDGYGNPDISLLACTPPPNYILDNTDCNDADMLINPAATEICNGLDENCNMLIDDGLFEYQFYADLDLDGYGDIDNFVSTCSDIVPSGYVNDFTDCNDLNIMINPGATEICNLIDDNCNLFIDEDLPLYHYYADADGDNFGDVNNKVTNCFSLPETGFVTDSTDCDDSNAAINPIAAEILNGLDDDCDQLIDEGLIAIQTFDNTFALNIFPNPAGEYVNVQILLNANEISNLQEYLTLSILDSKGVLISSTTIQTQQVINENLDIKNLPSGIYLIAIKSAEISSYMNFIKL